MITPLLEKMVLAGTAKYNRQTIGFATLQRIDVPQGTNLVLLLLELLPFLNEPVTGSDPLISKKDNSQFYHIDGDIVPDQLWLNKISATVARLSFQIRINVDNNQTHNITVRPNMDSLIYTSGGDLNTYFTFLPKIDSKAYDLYLVAKKFINIELVWLADDSPFNLVTAQSSSYFNQDNAVPVGYSNSAAIDSYFADLQSTTTQSFYAPKGNLAIFGLAKTQTETTGASNFVTYPTEATVNPATVVLFFNDPTGGIVDNIFLSFLPLFNIEYVELTAQGNIAGGVLTAEAISKL